MKSPSELLDEKITETLERIVVQVPYCTVSDLYDVIRWAKQGKLQLKVDNEAT